MSTETEHDPTVRAQWHWFNPEPMLDVLLYLAVLRRVRYLLALFFLLALATFFKRFDWLLADMSRFRDLISFVQRLVVTMFTINLFSHLFKGTQARYFGLPVPSFGMMMAFGLIPRFDIAIDTSGDMDRSARIWILSGGIMARAALFSVSIFIWIVTRDSGTFLPLTFSLVAFISVLTFFLQVNPFMASDGYKLLTLYLDRPKLRETAFRTLKGMFWEQPEVLDRHTENKVALRIYALSIIAFIVGVVCLVVYLLGTWLELNYRGFGIVILFIMILTSVSSFRQRAKLANQKKQLQKSRQRAAQGLPETEEEDADEPPRWYQGVVFKGAVFVLALILFFVPYAYEPGGEALVLPVSETQVHTEASGVVEEIFVEEGQWVSRDTVIARLSNHLQRKDLETTRAAIRASEEEIQRLLTTPSQEELALAREKIHTAEINLAYSEQHLRRMQSLHSSDDVTLAELEAAEEEYEVDKAIALEQSVNLAALQSQVSEHAIGAERAVLKGLQEDLAYYRREWEKTRLRMPVDGRIVTMNIQSMINKYLDEGELFVKLEDTRKVKVEIGVPEADITHVTRGNPVRLKVWAFPDRIFSGVVDDIHPATSSTKYGKVVPVVTLIDNDEELLKSGMSGQAKIRGEEMFLVEAFSRAFINFITIEMWSWLP